MPLCVKVSVLSESGNTRSKSLEGKFIGLLISILDEEEMVETAAMVAEISVKKSQRTRQLSFQEGEPPLRLQRELAWNWPLLVCGES